MQISVLSSPLFVCVFLLLKPTAMIWINSNPTRANGVYLKESTPGCDWPVVNANVIKAFKDGHKHRAVVGELIFSICK